jgi:drug/metabolite transporter (DMT)-like permease
MLGVFFIIFAGLLWAIDTLIRYPLLFSGVAASHIVFFEHLFLSFIFIPLLSFGPKKFRFKKITLPVISYFLVIGVCGSAIGTLTFTKAFMLINPSLVILLQKLQPLVAITLAGIFLKEKMSKSFIFLAIMALFGGFLISSPDIMPGLSKLNFSMNLVDSNSLYGYMLTLVAVVSWGASTVFGKKLSLFGLNEIEIMGGRFIFGFIFMFFYLIVTAQSLLPSWEMMNYGKIAFMVLLSGLLGMYVYYQGLKRISARTCALAEMFFPMSAVLINWIFLDAKLLPIQILGGVILLTSSLVIQLKKI